MSRVVSLSLPLSVAFALAVPSLVGASWETCGPSQRTATLYVFDGYLDLVAELEGAGVLASGPATELREFRDQLAEPQSPALETLCRAMLDMPSLPALVDDSRASFGGFDALQSSPCLNYEEEAAVLGLRLVAKTVDALLGLVCNNLKCIHLACSTGCFLQIASGFVIEALDFSLELSGFYCGGEHYTSMGAFAASYFPFATLTEGPIAGAKQGGAPGGIDLAAIEAEMRVSLIPSLATIAADGARSSTLENASANLGLQVSRLGAALRTVDAQLALDSTRRQAFQELSRRLEVERALQPSTTSPPLAMSLPASHGGRLEEVREVVGDAIARTTAAGEPTFDALTHFRSGNTLLNANKYSAAFEAYRQSYAEVIR